MISSKIKKDEEEGGVAGEWKYAAMVMDRFDHDADDHDHTDDHDHAVDHADDHADDQADDHADDHAGDHADDHADHHANADGEWKYAAMMIIISAFHMLKTFTKVQKVLSTV